MHCSTWVLWYQQELILKRSSFSLLTWAHWFLKFLMVIRCDWYNMLKGEYPCPLWTYLVEVFVVRWILEKDPKLVFLCKSFMIGHKIEKQAFWLDNIIREEGKDFGSNRESLSACPKILLNPVNLPTHQPAVYQLRLPREHLTLYATLCLLPARVPL